MRVALSLLAAVIPAMPPATAAAQVCTGEVGFERYPAHLGVGYSAQDGGNLLSGSVKVGSAGLFAGLGAGILDVDDIDDNAHPVFGSIGAQTGIGPWPNAHLCPVLTVSYARTSNVDGSGVDISMRDIGAGIAVGFSTVLSPEVMMLPALEVDALFTRFAVDNGSGTLSDTDTAGLLTIGIGFLINGRISLTPSIAVPFAVDGGADPGFALGASIGLGTR